MAKQSGTFTIAEGDSYTAPEMLEPAMRKAIKAQLDALAFASFTADREVIARELPTIRRVDLEFLVVAGAEARTRWLVQALAHGKTKKLPSAAEVEELARLRQTYQELAAAFEALKRLIERGYTRLE